MPLLILLQHLTPLSDVSVSCQNVSGGRYGTDSRRIRSLRRRRSPVIGSLIDTIAAGCVPPTPRPGFSFPVAGNKSLGFDRFDSGRPEAAVAGNFDGGIFGAGSRAARGLSLVRVYSADSGYAAGLPVNTVDGEYVWLE